MENLTNSAEEVLIDSLSLNCLQVANMSLTGVAAPSTLKEATRIQLQLAPRSFAFVSLEMGSGLTPARFASCSMLLTLILHLM